MSVYQVHASPVVTERGLKHFEFPARLFVGLPQPEGFGWEELSSTRGYQRQPLRLHLKKSGNAMSGAFNADTISFDSISPEDPHITHVGVFDGDGALWFYGLLDGDGERRPTGPIEFRPATFHLVFSNSH
jgi:hypothetical protein